MRKYIVIIIVLGLTSCTDKRHNLIRKIPCENIFTYEKAGTLNGVYLTLYYAVDYQDSVPIKVIRSATDSIFKKIDVGKYSGGVFWFLKESPELQKIKNCEVTDTHNISSDDHKVLALFTYDTRKRTLEEIHIDKDGNYTFQPFRR